MQKELQAKVVELLPRVSCFIAHGPGTGLLDRAPLLVRSPEGAQRVSWDRFCIANLATYLPPQKRPPGWLFEADEKVGVVLKGCDSRAVIQLLNEEIIDRERFLIIGLPCEGMIDPGKLSAKIDINMVSRVETDGQTIMVFTNNGEVSADMGDLFYDKCLACEYPNTLIYDEFLGERVAAAPKRGAFAGAERIEAMSVEERKAFWDKEFARCIRCKACRNVCPICYCQNQCLLDTRVPKWVKERVDGGSNEWFHLVRAFHLAGRCTECEECARVCPVNIPINLLPMKMNRELCELFGWRSGVREGQKSPLMTFKLEEEKIK